MDGRSRGCRIPRGGVVVAPSHGFSTYPIRERLSLDGSIVLESLFVTLTASKVLTAYYSILVLRHVRLVR